MTLYEQYLRRRVGRLCRAMDRIQERAEKDNRLPTADEWARIKALDEKAEPLQLELMAMEAERESERQAEYRALIEKAKALLGK